MSHCITVIIVLTVANIVLQRHMNMADKLFSHAYAAGITMSAEDVRWFQFADYITVTS